MHKKLTCVRSSYKQLKLTLPDVSKQAEGRKVCILPIKEWTYQDIWLLNIYIFRACLYTKGKAKLTGANKKKERAQLQTTSKAETTYKCFPSSGSQKHFSCNTLIAQGLKV